MLGMCFLTFLRRASCSRSAACLGTGAPSPAAEGAGLRQGVSTPRDQSMRPKHLFTSLSLGKRGVRVGAHRSSLRRGQWWLSYDSAHSGFGRTRHASSAPARVPRAGTLGEPVSAEAITRSARGPAVGRGTGWEWRRELLGKNCLDTVFLENSVV